MLFSSLSVGPTETAEFNRIQNFSDKKTTPQVMLAPDDPKNVRFERRLSAQGDDVKCRCR